MDSRNPLWPHDPPPPSILDDEMVIRDADRPVRNVKRSDLPRRSPSGIPSDSFIAGFCLGVVVALPLWAFALAFVNWVAGK